MPINWVRRIDLTTTEFTMNININNLNNNSSVKAKTDTQNEMKQESTRSTANAVQEKQARQDSVSLTPQAKHLNELQKKSADAPVINQKKMQQLQKAIAAGEYKINPEKLAANIANFEFNLI